MIDLRDPGIHEVPRGRHFKVTRGAVNDNGYVRGLLVPIDHFYIVDSIIVVNIDSSARTLDIDVRESTDYNTTTDYSYDASNTHFLHDDYDRNKKESFTNKAILEAYSIAGSTMFKVIDKNNPLYLDGGTILHFRTNTDDNDIQANISFRDFF